MKLISCHIENFGCLQNFDYFFSDGVNIICRENGWGKSTFAAFLLAMFYGLPSRGKKRQAVFTGNRMSRQDVRSTYRPWQGGVFGGSLIFEAGGRTYEMTRVFGNRESEDDFDLRDPDTNLPCFDYTKNIGKELFALDRESFLRTVFISQQDCGTEPTDDVNALITDLAENAGDMESYEEAQKRLKDAANRLTPKRGTGRLYRTQERIRQLERDTAGSNDLEDNIVLCSREQNELAQRIKTLEAERTLLEKKTAEAEKREKENAGAGQEESIPVKKQLWQQLQRTYERRQKSMENASSFFPGRVPTRAEAEEFLKNCREMERMEERMQAEMLTEEEQERLTVLEEQFAQGSDYVITGKTSRTGRDREVPDSKRGEASGAGIFPSHAGIMLILAAAVLVLLAYGTGSVKGAAVPVMTIAAILLAAAGGGIAAAVFLNRTAENVDRQAIADFSDTDYLREEDPHDEKARVYAEYKYLEGKEQKVEKTHADWAEARKPILRFLRELGFDPSEDLHAQLTSIRDAADDCEDARILLRESREEVRLFEEELRRCGLTPEKMQQAGLKSSKSPDSSQQKVQSAAELRARRDEIREDILQCHSQELDIERRMEELIRERDDRDMMLDELKELRAQQEKDLAGYRQVTMASDLLQRAKESLTARYADPIRISFCNYWEMITGSSAAGIYVDANSNVTIEEKGRQRDSASFSTGWRDLAGICLRTALADAMYPPDGRERPFLVLDDPFTNLDDGKIEGAMCFLRETGRNYQILYFTCSGARC